MKKYKMVALDIDGTTVDSKGKLSDHTIDVIQKTVKKGVPVCLCTGRNVRNTMPIVKKLNVKTPFICIDGAVMYDPVEKKVIKEKIIPRDTLKEISKIADKYHVYMEFCTFNNYIKYLKERELEKYSYGGVPKNPIQKTRFFFNGVRIVDSLEKIYSIKNNINQFLIGGDEKTIAKIKEELETKAFDDVILRYDLWENYIFVASKDAVKSEGVKLLCDHYDIDISEAIAVGDQMNDIDMIIKAGFGIAMGNAHDKIKEAADHITITNDENGVAKILEEFVL
ncbi:MAG: HAD family hydrolase [Lachnospirales bacterium]